MISLNWSKTAAKDFINALILRHGWTTVFDFSNVDALSEAIKATNALEHSRAQFKLVMPDSSPAG